MEDMRCLNCNEIIPHGNLKDRQYQKRKFCSHQCQMDYEQKQWEEKWLNGEVSGNKDTVWTQVSQRLKTYLFKKYDNKCSICGWSKVNPFTGNIPLEVEHIDGDPYNSSPDNVTLLCPNCHALTKTYRGANRGHGRKKTWMPLTYDNMSQSI